MAHYDFSKQEAARKRKAIWITVLVYVTFAGGIWMATQPELGDWKSMVPEPLKEWLNIESPAPAEATKDSDRA